MRYVAAFVTFAACLAPFAGAADTPGLRGVLSDENPITLPDSVLLSTGRAQFSADAVGTASDDAPLFDPLNFPAITRQRGHAEVILPHVSRVTTHSNGGNAEGEDGPFGTARRGQRRLPRFEREHGVVSGPGPGELGRTDDKSNFQQSLHRLMFDVLGPQYNRNARPLPTCGVVDQDNRCSHKIPLHVGLQFTKLEGVDADRQTLSMLVTVTMAWPDHRLSFNYSDYFPTMIRWNHEQDFLAIDPELLWRPDVQLANSVEPPRAIVSPRAFLYDQEMLKQRGYNVLIRTPMAVTVKCDLQMDAFPFDSQVCRFNWRAWSANQKWVVLQALQDSKDALNATISALHARDNEFKVMSIQLDEGFQDVYGLGDGDESFPELEYTVTLKRASHYYVASMLMPMFITILLSVGVFYIDPPGGERLGYNITLFLTVMALAFYSADRLPKSGGGDTWLERFQALCYIITIFPIFVSLFCELGRRHLRRFHPRSRFVHVQDAHDETINGTFRRAGRELKYKHEKSNALIYFDGAWNLSSSGKIGTDAWTYRCDEDVDVEQVPVEGWAHRTDEVSSIAVVDYPSEWLTDYVDTVLRAPYAWLTSAVLLYHLYYIYQHDAGNEMSVLMLEIFLLVVAFFLIASGFWDVYVLRSLVKTDGTLGDIATALKLRGLFTDDPMDEPEEEDLAAVNVHIEGVDFDSLEPEQRRALASAVAQVMTGRLDLPAAGMRDEEGEPGSMTLSRGSVIADSLIRVPVGSLAFDDVEQTLTSESMPLQLMEALQSIPGVSSALEQEVPLSVTVKVRRPGAPNFGDEQGQLGRAFLPLGQR